MNNPNKTVSKKALRVLTLSLFLISAPVLADPGLILVGIFIGGASSWITGASVYENWDSVKEYLGYKTEATDPVQSANGNPLKPIPVSSTPNDPGKHPEDGEEVNLRNDVDRNNGGEKDDNKNKTSNPLDSKSNLNKNDDKAKGGANSQQWHTKPSVGNLDGSQMVRKDNIGSKEFAAQLSHHEKGSAEYERLMASIDMGTSPAPSVTEPQGTVQKGNLDGSQMVRKGNIGSKEFAAQLSHHEKGSAEYERLMASIDMGTSPAPSITEPQGTVQKGAEDDGRQKWARQQNFQKEIQGHVKAGDKRRKEKELNKIQMTMLSDGNMLKGNLDGSQMVRKGNIGSKEFAAQLSHHEKGSAEYERLMASIDMGTSPAPSITEPQGTVQKGAEDDGRQKWARQQNFQKEIKGHVKAGDKRRKEKELNKIQMTMLSDGNSVAEKGNLAPPPQDITQNQGKADVRPTDTNGAESGDTGLGGRAQKQQDIIIEVAPGEDPDEALARRLKAEFGNTLAGPDGFTVIPEKDQVCEAPDYNALAKTDGKTIDRTEEWKAERRAAAKQRAKETLDKIQGTTLTEEDIQAAKDYEAKMQKQAAYDQDMQNQADKLVNGTPTLPTENTITKTVLDDQGTCAAPSLPEVVVTETGLVTNQDRLSHVRENVSHKVEQIVDWLAGREKNTIEEEIKKTPESGDTGLGGRAQKQQDIIIEVAPGEDPDEALARRLKAEFGNTLAGPDGFTVIPEKDQVCEAPDYNALAKTDGKTIDRTEEWKAERRAAAKQRAKKTLNNIKGSSVPQAVTQDNITSKEFAAQLSHHEKGSAEYERLMASIDMGTSPAPSITEPQGTVQKGAEDDGRQKWARQQNFQKEIKGHVKAGDKRRKEKELNKIQMTMLSDGNSVAEKGNLDGSQMVRKGNIGSKEFAAQLSHHEKGSAEYERLMASIDMGTSPAPSITEPQGTVQKGAEDDGRQKWARQQNFQKEIQGHVKAGDKRRKEKELNKIQMTMLSDGNSVAEKGNLDGSQMVRKDNIGSKEFAAQLSHHEKGSAEYERLMASIDMGTSPAPSITEPQGTVQKGAEDDGRQKWARQQNFQKEIQGHVKAGDKRRKEKELNKIQMTMLSDGNK